MSISPLSGVSHGDGISPVESIGGAGISATGSSPPPAYVGPLDLVPEADWGPCYSTAYAPSAAMLGQNGITLRRETPDADLSYEYDATTGKISKSAIDTWRGMSDAYFAALLSAGSANNAVQATDAVQPIYDATDIDAEPSAGTIDGVFTRLVTANNISYSGGFTIFVVGKYDSAVFGDGGILGVNSDSGVNWFEISANGGGGGVYEGHIAIEWWDSDGTNYVDAYTTDDVSELIESPFVLTVTVSDTGDESVRINGVNKALTIDRQGASIPPFSDKLTISAGAIDGSNQMGGWIQTVLVAHEILSVPQIELVEAKLMTQI